MPTTFGTISPEELAARREVATDIERFRREYQNSVEERDMPEPTKNYLGLCCRANCARYKIMFITRKHPEAVVDSANMTVRIGNDRFMFVIDPNTNYARIMGLEITEYKVCVHYNLSEEVRSMLNSRLRQRGSWRTATLRR